MFFLEVSPEIRDPPQSMMCQGQSFTNQSTAIPAPFFSHGVQIILSFTALYVALQYFTALSKTPSSALSLQVAFSTDHLALVQCALMNNALAFKLVMSLCREGRVIKGYTECWPAQFYFQCKRKENSLIINSLDSCHDFTSDPSVNCSLFSGQQTLIFLVIW